MKVFISYAPANQSLARRVSNNDEIPWILRHLNTISLPEQGQGDEGLEQITQALQAVA